MGKVTTALTMSLDGYIAGANDGPDRPLGEGGEPLFDWYRGGDTPGDHFPEFRMSRTSARVFDETVHACGAVISGRRTYDISNAWDGEGVIPGIPLFVLTHRPPERVPSGRARYTFVTDGIESAVAQAKAAAGDRDVDLMGSAPVRQCLGAGLLDELTVHVVPMLLGHGVRLLDEHAARLERVRVVEAPGVTHLTFRVLR